MSSLLQCPMLMTGRTYENQANWCLGHPQPVAVHVFCVLLCVSAHLGKVFKLNWPYSLTTYKEKRGPWDKNDFAQSMQLLRAEVQSDSQKNPWLLRETIFKLSNDGWLSADLNWWDRQLARPALINMALLLPPPRSQGCDTFTDSLSLSTSNNNTNNQCLVPPDTPGPVMNHTRPGSGDGFSMQQTTEGF